MQKINSKKQVLWIVTILILVLLILFFSYQKGMEIQRYQNDYDNIKKTVTALGCEYMKVDKAKDDNDKLDIYIKAKYDLYTQEKSNENFYNRLVEGIAKAANYQDIRIWEKNYNNKIDVICSYNDQQIYRVYINGEYNYYSNRESQKAIQNYQRTVETNIIPQAKELIEAIQNEWKKDSFTIEEKPITYEKYDIYNNTGIKIRTIQGKIFNLIYTNSYQKNVMNQIQPGETLEKVIQVLGTPTFGNLEDELIGYKGKDFYAFFTPEEISLYRVEEVTQSTLLEEALNQYQEEKLEKNFVTTITDMWEDYDRYNYDTYLVDLSYALRGIKIQYGVTKNHGVIVYNNYTGTIIEQKTIEQLQQEDKVEIPENVYFINTDAVYESEKERVGQERARNSDDEELVDEYFKSELAE